MKFITPIVAFGACSGVLGFVPTTALPCTSLVSLSSASLSNSCTCLKMAYVPDGLTEAQYQAILAKDKAKVEGKDLGKLGVTGFKSRSMQAWQKSGAPHLFPVRNDAPNESKPYMQRHGGKWDDSDILKDEKLAKQKWTKDDEEYDAFKEKKNQSAGFWFGTISQEKLPWNNK